MGKELDLKFKGLWTAPNDYTTPSGALDVADNTVNDQKDLGEPRRGFETYIDNDGGGLDGFPLKSFIATDPNSTTFGLLTYRLNEGTQDGRLLIDDEDTIAGDNRFLPPPTAIVPRMVNWGAYVYVSSDQGIKRYSASLNSSVPAGIPQALDLILSLTGSSGYLTSNESAVVTATRTSGSPTLTTISDAEISDFTVGSILTGTGIPDGTTVSSVSLSAPVVIHDAALTGGSTTIVVASNAGIATNQIVSGQGIQENSRVASISGAGPYNVVLTIAAIETAAANSVTFSSDNTVTMSANATSGAPTVTSVTISEGCQVAYRLVWGLRNENDAIMLGAPSAFTAITNSTGGTRNVIVNASIPDGITTDNFWQLYRSVATPTQNIVPPDQMQLVAEGVPSGTDISNGFIQVTDQTPDSLKGEALYTGSDVEGISQSNFRPPTAVDVCLFRGHTIYLNYTLPHQLKLILDGVGAPDGVQINDEIEISTSTDSFTLTAEAVEDIAAGEFAVVTSGTPAQNIADTAASFIRVLNRYSMNDICYAQLLSGPNDLPGQILLEARPGIDEFEVEASANGDAWTPDIDTAVSSEAENTPNGLLVSKAQQPEAVPRENLFYAGGIGNQGIRAVALRDYVVIWTGNGIFRLTGQSLSDFGVEPFDLTAQLVAPETAVSLGNECWALTSQGAVSVSDGGVRIRSGLQINDVLQSLIRQAPNSLREFAFAVGYESDQRFILALPDSEGDEVNIQQFCYNYIQETWTRWTRNCTAGYVHPLAGLFLGNGNNANVVKERKGGNFTDYVDEAIPVLVQSYTGLEVVLDTVTGVAIGDLLWQNQSGTVVYSEIVDIDIPALTVTVAAEIMWDIGGAAADTAVLQAIESIVQWKPMDGGDPTEVKQHSEGQIIFRRARFLNASMKFATDISPGFDEVELLGQSGGSWGLFPWGESPWGGVTRPSTLRFYVPQDKQYAGVIIPRLEIRSGYSNWQLEGGSIIPFDIGYELGGPGGDE